MEGKYQGGTFFLVNVKALGNFVICNGIVLLRLYVSPALV